MSPEAISDANFEYQLELGQEITELEKQRNELLEMIYNSALSVVTMGHTIDMEELAQVAYIITGINAEQNASELRNQAKGES